ncbi:IS3 family transposase [Proteus mirabilis]
MENIYHEHKGRYGYRRIHLTLKNEGTTLNHKTVQRLMRQLNLKSTVRPKNIVHTVVMWAKQCLTISNEILQPANQMKSGARM